MATQKRSIPLASIAKAEDSRSVLDVFDNPYVNRAFEDSSIPLSKVAGSGSGTIHSTLLLFGISLAVSQEPSVTDTILQVEFGVAQGGGGDPVQLSSAGLLTFNQAMTVEIIFRGQFGRSGSGGVVIIHGRSLFNGSAGLPTFVTKLVNTNNLIHLESGDIIDVEATDTFAVQIYRDSNGTNAGGLFKETASLVGWADAPSATIEVRQIEVL